MYSAFKNRRIQGFSLQAEPQHEMDDKAREPESCESNKTTERTQTPGPGNGDLASSLQGKSVTKPRASAKPLPTIPKLLRPKRTIVIDSIPGVPTLGDHGTERNEDDETAQNSETPKDDAQSGGDNDFATEVQDGKKAEENEIDTQEKTSETKNKDRIEEDSTRTGNEHETCDNAQTNRFVREETLVDTEENTEMDEPSKPGNAGTSTTQSEVETEATTDTTAEKHIGDGDQDPHDAGPAPKSDDETIQNDACPGPKADDDENARDGDDQKVDDTDPDQVRQDLMQVNEDQVQTDFDPAQLDKDADHIENGDGRTKFRIGRTRTPNRNESASRQSEEGEEMEKADTPKQRTGVKVVGNREPRKDSNEDSSLETPSKSQRPENESSTRAGGDFNDNREVERDTKGSPGKSVNENHLEPRDGLITTRPRPNLDTGNRLDDLRDKDERGHEVEGDRKDPPFSESKSSLKPERLDHKNRRKTIEEWSLSKNRTKRKSSSKSTPSSKSKTMDLAPYEAAPYEPALEEEARLFNLLWVHLRKKGWSHTKGMKSSFAYLAPGVSKKSQGKSGVDYFETESDLLLNAKIRYPSLYGQALSQLEGEKRERLYRNPPAPLQFRYEYVSKPSPSQEAHSASSKLRMSSEIKSRSKTKSKKTAEQPHPSEMNSTKDSKSNRSPSKGSALRATENGRQKRMRESVAPPSLNTRRKRRKHAGVDDELEHVTKEQLRPYRVLPSLLVSEKDWTCKKGTGLSSFQWFKPGKSIVDEEGVDYFNHAESVIKYCLQNRDEYSDLLSRIEMDAGVQPLHRPSDKRSKPRGEHVGNSDIVGLEKNKPIELDDDEDEHGENVKAIEYFYVDEDTGDGATAIAAEAEQGDDQTLDSETSMEIEEKARYSERPSPSSRKPRKKMKLLATVSSNEARRSSRVTSRSSHRFRDDKADFAEYSSKPIGDAQLELKSNIAEEEVREAARRSGLALLEKHLGGRGQGREVDGDGVDSELLSSTREKKKDELDQDVMETGRSANKETVGNIFEGLVFDFAGFNLDRSPTRQSLHKLVQDHGGNFASSSVEAMEDKMICISRPDAHRSASYLRSIARGSPCLHYNWIYDSIEKKQRLDWRPYELPAGYSYLNNQLVFFPKRSKSRRSSTSNASNTQGSGDHHFMPTLFVNERVFWGFEFFVLGKPSFRRKWETILDCASANVVSKVSKETDYVICDPEDTSKTTREALEEIIELQDDTSRLELYNPDWVVECLITKAIQTENEETAYEFQVFKSSWARFLVSNFKEKLPKKIGLVLDELNRTTSLARRKKWNDRAWALPPLGTKSMRPQEGGWRMKLPVLRHRSNRFMACDYASFAYPDVVKVTTMPGSIEDKLSLPALRYGRIREMYQDFGRDGKLGEMRVCLDVFHIVSDEEYDSTGIPVCLEETNEVIHCKADRLVSKLCVVHRDGLPWGLSMKYDHLERGDVGDLVFVINNEEDE